MADNLPKGLRQFRMILWGLVIVAAIGATALFLLRPPTNPLGLTGKPFALESTQGGVFTEASLRGTPSMVFFGYTSCPDVCPTMLAESQAWREELKIAPEQLRTIFVTVDPKRDTKEVLSAYLGGFDPHIIGLVGDDAETTAAKTAFGVISENTEPDASGFYLVNHTATLFLIGRDGSFAGTIAYGEDRETALAKLKKLLAS